jgi:hypothetical protein
MHRARLRRCTCCVVSIIIDAVFNQVQTIILYSHNKMLSLHRMNWSTGDAFEVLRDGARAGARGLFLKCRASAINVAGSLYYETLDIRSSLASDEMLELYTLYCHR